MSLLAQMMDRIKSIQARCNAVLNSSIAVDGILGNQTLGAIEGVLSIAESAVTAPDSDAGSEGADDLPSEFDERTEKNLATLHPSVQNRFRGLMDIAIDEAAKQGLTVKIIGGSRSWDEQQSLYDQGRTKPGDVVTNAKPGYSWHNFGIAVDFGLFRGSDYIDDNTGDDARLMREVYLNIATRSREAGDFFWGGHWTTLGDYPHFHLNVAHTLSDARRQYEAGTWLA